MKLQRNWERGVWRIPEPFYRASRPSITGPSEHIGIWNTLIGRCGILRSLGLNKFMSKLRVGGCFSSFNSDYIGKIWKPIYLEKSENQPMKKWSVKSLCQGLSTLASFFAPRRDILCHPPIKAYWKKSKEAPLLSRFWQRIWIYSYFTACLRKYNKMPY